MKQAREALDSFLATVFEFAELIGAIAAVLFIIWLFRTFA
jgi:flagellar biogenesis protein FliO